MRYIDSHCHFDFADFDTDRERVWQTCMALGVAGLVIPGVSPANWPTAAKISTANAGIFYAVGLHPWWVTEAIAPDHLRAQLIAAAHYGKSDKGDKCVAIGECGLDAVIELPIAVQLPVFELQLQVAVACDLPVIIHSRQAHSEVMAAIKRNKPARGGVIHAFSGSYEIARQYWDMGFYLGIGGTITYERAHKTREAVKRMPLEALLLESDAPDMPLQGKQGQRNSPEYIPLIAQALAELCGESVSRIAEQSTHNAQTLFKLSI